MLLVLNKPFGVLSQFTPDQPGQRTLAEVGLPPRVYPLGRLDQDSEGMLLLSDEPGLNDGLLNPRHAHWRTYAVQVEGVPEEAALEALRRGVVIQSTPTRPARARRIEEPHFPARNPPVRFRKNIPTSWVAVSLQEGRNRQVRRMTAAIGHPTLRLVRVEIGKFKLPADLLPGQWRELSVAERGLVFL
jgi:23S rRNA pseudouridine2457 synthase